MKFTSASDFIRWVEVQKRFSKKDETEIDSCNFHDHKKLLTEIKKLCKQKDSKAY